MKFFQRVYCRSVQMVFRCALPFLPYREPKVIDHVSELPRILHERGISRILLVTDRRIREYGITRVLETELAACQIFYAVYDGTLTNPTTQNVEDARKLYCDTNCQAMIAVGGGSSIDCAKAVGARIARPKKSLQAMKGILKVRKKIPLLIAIPTTAGTGSETTLAAVITDAKTRHKYPINDFALIPRYTVLDPEVTRTLPPDITATTGLDALTHAVEAFIGHSTTRQTRKKAIQAVKLIFENIQEAYRNGNNMQARKNMLKAAYLAGAAFSKSYVGYVHAVAHSLGGRYNTPHGLANAVLLPVFLEAYGETVYQKLWRLAVELGIVEQRTSYAQGAGAFIEELVRLETNLKIPKTLKEICPEDIPQLAQYASQEANPLYPVPKLYDAEELAMFYEAVMEKRIYAAG